LTQHRSAIGILRLCHGFCRSKQQNKSEMLFPPLSALPTSTLIYFADLGQSKNTRQSLNCIIALLQLASPIKKPRQFACFIQTTGWFKHAAPNGKDA
jgi:hypothetical protein